MVTHTGFGGLLGEVTKVPSVTPRFVAFVSLILKLRLSLPSLPRAMRNLNKTARGLCSTPSPWAFRQELPGGNLQLYGQAGCCTSLKSLQRADFETAVSIPTNLT